MLPKAPQRHGRTPTRAWPPPPRTNRAQNAKRSDIGAPRRAPSKPKRRLGACNTLNEACPHLRWPPPGRRRAARPAREGGRVDGHPATGARFQLGARSRGFAACGVVETQMECIRHALKAALGAQARAEARKGAPRNGANGWRCSALPGGAVAPRCNMWIPQPNNIVLELIAISGAWCLEARKAA